MRRNTKMTQISGTTNSSRTEEVLGNCYKDDNPDAWFPEAPRGAQTPAKMEALGRETSRAIILCNACPKKEPCLEEGMKPKNLSYGIWGGRLSGERILLADARGIEYMVNGRTNGEYVHTGDLTKRVGKGRYKGSVVIKESDGVTVEEKRNALNLLRRLTPWIRK
jgi:hypothetical protein